MTRGRKRLADRSLSKDISIPESVVLQVDLLLLNRLRGRVIPGSWSKLVTRLLREWLDQQAGACDGTGTTLQFPENFPQPTPGVPPNDN